jgi:heme exporter protein CcmD
MDQFLAMGGYGRFVWPSYALAVAVFAWNILAARRRFTSARERATRAAAVARAAAAGPAP